MSKIVVIFAGPLDLVRFLLLSSVFANMNTIGYRSMAEEWLSHIVQQYGRIQVRKKDLPLIEHLLRAGFTLIAVRDKSKMLQIDFLGRKSGV